MSRSCLSKSIRVICLVSILLPAWVFSQDSVGMRPFSGKVIFSETPEIGEPWHGGIRMNDFLVWDGFFNIIGWFSLDLLYAGLGSLKVAENAEISDNFYAFTAKCRPLALDLGGKPYKLSVGFKMFGSNFSLVSTEDKVTDSMISIVDRSFVLFAAQGCSIAEKHYVNLFASVSSRDKVSATFYVIPSYRYALGKKWSVSLEYYMTNSLRLPIKVLQYAFDNDRLDFYNTEREWYSFMIYGFQYSGEHLRVDLNLANHISFQQIILPVLGIGWNF